ncbi:MFS transporter [Agaricicola taiwanensis]|uniref:MFS transporter n=1 Tax=Agaricicola taiwanensis TaxID=591372 RepID=A0A8J2YJK5_9RHOB|nr:MFS transporter [Agaricicola taiwanensis]GGE47939.1 MFS transporter [Agaricicola taiwanensis]
MADIIAPSQRTAKETVTYAVLMGISICHLLNDVMQSVLLAIYPMLKATYSLSFWQIGLLTMAFQVTASLLQPLIGLYTDKRSLPYSLPAGMACSLVGLVLLGWAESYAALLVGSCFVGFGSAIFHPEASRVARMASGGRHGLAQSLFQVGGNLGTASGPLLAAFIVVPRGQGSIGWFSVVALVGMVLLWNISGWYVRTNRANAGKPKPSRELPLPRHKVLMAIGLLAMLVFTKHVYSTSLTSYYTFFLIHKFEVSLQTSQILLFVFLGATAFGTLMGGPLGDRFGSKTVIWFSILGALPFTLALPYVDLFWTGVLTAVIGFIMASAFPAIVVFAQDLLPGRVGLVAGLFFGFAFGMGGIGAAVLGVLADSKGIDYVYSLTSFMPLLGLATVFLPNLKAKRKA